MGWLAHPRTQDVDVTSSVALQWRYDGQKIEIAYADPVNAGETRTFTVDYVLKKPVTGAYCAVIVRVCLCV